MLNFLGLSSDSAGDLRRRRSRLGRLASEGTVEIKVWGFRVRCYIVRSLFGSVVLRIATKEFRLGASHLGQRR